MGQRVCEMLTGGLTGNPNPVPVVRGVVSRLQSSGMDKHQAVGLMRASVFIYCPQRLMSQRFTLRVSTLQEQP